jgi:hypothetical protein
MKTLSCIIAILICFSSSAQKFKNISTEDLVQFENMRNLFKYTVYSAEQNHCCFEDSLISKNYRLYYQQVNAFLFACKPGKNLDSLETKQVISLVERIDFIINSSIDTGFRISTSQYVRHVGYTSYEHWLFLNELNIIMVRKKLVQKQFYPKEK